MAVGTWSNPYGAEGGGLPSTGDISMFSSKPFGGGSMFGTLLGGGLSLFGSILGARSQAAAAQAQVDASADQLKNNIMLAREARKGALGGRIGQNVADYGYGADLDFGRQKRASIFDSTRKRDLERAANIDDFNAMIGMKDTPAFREQQQRQFRRDLQKALVERQAAMEGMFGPISRSF